jgi:hypothetical protein
MDLLKKLEAYFRNTPPEQIKSEWDSTAHLDQESVTVTDFLTNTTKAMYNYKEQIELLEAQRTKREELQETLVFQRKELLYNRLQPFIDFICYLHFECGYTKDILGDPMRILGTKSDEDMYRQYVADSVFRDCEFTVLFPISVGRFFFSLDANGDLTIKQDINDNIKSFAALEQIIILMSKAVVEECYKLPW